MALDISALVPELLVIGLGLLLLIIHILQRQPVPANPIGWVAFLAFTAIALFVVWRMPVAEVTWGGTWLVDPLANFFKILFLLAAALVSLASITSLAGQSRFASEYIVLLSMATAAMMCVISAGDLLTLYVGLEFLAITLVVLTALDRGTAASEAGLKYLILNAISSAALLYGFSLLYGMSGSLVLGEIATIIAGGATQAWAGLALPVAIVLVLSGFAFKTSLVPFHMWSIDVYHGAPTPITAFFAIGSKAAGFAVLIRVFMKLFIPWAAAWVPALIVLSILTFTLGNLVAIPQTDIKRFLAYASIGSAGYIIMGMIAATRGGIEAMLFYAMIYVFATFGAFAVATAVQAQTGSTAISALAGLSKRSPFLALTMLLCTLSLAGVPGLAGFIGKFYIFWAVIDQGYAWLALLGIIVSILSVYYFLLLAKVMYVNDPPAESAIIRVMPSMRLALAVSVFATVFFGVYPGPLINLVTQVAARFIS